ncbi:hypothetical protein C8N25_1244 [Algoriphagus antarcticus]|uniref:Uncharacterized protein n=1 Tax=Algoriphagus antarcticus TaxID=238540 RepID=A0A3E0DGN2_9BACT|nr:hypothetical protein C8N25_1244 [Algoriphagus antarcticus]
MLKEQDEMIWSYLGNRISGRNSTESFIDKVFSKGLSYYLDPSAPIQSK